MESRIVFLVVAAFAAPVLSSYRPSYIKPCDLHSSSFKQCALENANYAIPFIVKGDKRMGIPPLNPLELPLVEIQQSNFKLTLKDAKIYGLEDITATSLDLDLKHFDATFHIDRLNILGTYLIDGKVLVLNLKGEGPANITAIGGDYHVTTSITSYEKNGETYLKIERPTLDFKLQKAHFDFGNLLSGDEKLGPEINNLLNENWEGVLNDLGAPIKETVTTIIESIVSKIFDKLPQKYLLPN